MWVWASMRPGRRVASPRSMVSAPAGMAAVGPTATILSLVTTMRPGETMRSDLPSKRRAALRTYVLSAADSERARRKKEVTRIILDILRARVQWWREAGIPRHDYRACKFASDTIQRLAADFDGG